MMQINCDKFLSGNESEVRGSDKQSATLYLQTLPTRYTWPKVMDWQRSGLCSGECRIKEANPRDGMTFNMPSVRRKATVGEHVQAVGRSFGSR